MSEFDFLRQAPHTAFLFPGQGSQHVGMAADLVAAYPTARATLEEADDLLNVHLSQLCLEGPDAALTDTVNAQPALLAVSVAFLRVLAEELEVPAPATEQTTFLAGHSLGEYTALVAGGSLCYADALRLVRTRGELMRGAGRAAPGQMAAVLGLDAAAVTTILAAVARPDDVVQVANDNCPGQLVISGNRSGMEHAIVALRDGGARKVVPLNVSIASHSPLMAPAAEALAAAIDTTPIRPPMLPVLGNTTARPLLAVESIRNELKAQLTGQVRWTESMQYAIDQGATRFVEIGAGDVLIGLVKRIDRKATRLAVNNVASVQALAASLTG